jgi:dihydroxyacid dehydratase/phosphogluconate dehydratase
VIKHARFSNGYGEESIDLPLWYMEDQFIPENGKGESLNIVSAFEALGKFNNTIAPEDFKVIGPCAGACGGMYTANTMSSSIEALGMSLPYSSSNPALSEEKTRMY